MTHDSGGRFVILHALRVRTLADVGGLADATGLDVPVVEDHLAELAAEGLATERLGARPGWTLTATGRTHHDAAAADDLVASGATHAVEAAYGRFLELNQPVLAACAAWQLRDDGSNIRNDHADADYDERVVARLVALHERAVPVVAALSAAMRRFGSYGPRLQRAVEGVVSGAGDWFTRPTIDSYHTVWFELHEDLLRTLGIPRGSESVVQTAESARPDETETV